MFERRLKFLLIVLALPTVAVAIRLVQLQIFAAAEYQAAADRMLDLPGRLYPCVRGAIVDYEGRPLARDAASWSIAVHYAVMADDPAIRKRVFAKLGVHKEPNLETRIAESWDRIVSLTRMPREELEEEARRIVARIQRRKQYLEELRGMPMDILEEVTAHAVVTGLDQSEQVEARIALAPYPWVEVVPGHSRRYESGAAVAHLLGHMIRVTDKALRNDPQAEDELARYQAEDFFGVSGAEAMGEQWLRGTRGWVHEDQEGNPIDPPVDARNGNDVRLTIDLALQQELYRRLGEEIERKYPNSTGGCAVVLDLPSRQVLAMVDYPSIDPRDPGKPTGKAAHDLCGPWTFRAVARPYSPGSIVKPMLLAGAVSEGKVDASTRVDCYRCLSPDQPDRWRCTGTHPSADPVYAIQHSCNVFFYVVGDRMGVPLMGRWMSLFGLGQEAGTRLREDSSGNLPKTRGQHEYRYAAIGQGELEVTPIQAANMVACIATGTYQPVQLWANDPEPRPAPAELPVSASAWRMVREGMYKAVNERGGTAFEKIDLHEPGEYTLLGKTGSAEARPPVWIYTCRFPDGRLQHIRARNWTEIRNRYEPDARPQRVDQQKPPEYDVTNGWFVGYLTRKDRYLQPVRGDDLSVAIAVVIEFAGHGGDVAAPVASDMIDSILYRHRSGAAGRTALDTSRGFAALGRERVRAVSRVAAGGGP